MVESKKFEWSNLKERISQLSCGYPSWQFYNTLQVLSRPNETHRYACTATNFFFCFYEIILIKIQFELFFSKDLRYITHS